MVERSTDNRKVRGSTPLILANLGGGGRLSAVSIFLLEKTMMIKEISDREILSVAPIDLRFRHDREDVYRLCGERRSEHSRGRRLFYEPYEIKCNPDIDF